MAARSAHRRLPAFLVALWVAVPAAADFTEYEDQPFLTPGGTEVDALTGPEPIPWDSAEFLDAFPTGAMLIRGHLDAADIDAYEVELLAGDLLLAALFDPDSGAFLDAVLGVFSGGAPPALALDDDGGRGFLARLGHAAGGTGPVQVAVSGYGDASFDGTHDEAAQALAAYDLVLAVARNGATPSETEPNDARASAGLLASGAGLFAASLSAGDVDYYAVDLEEGDRLLASVFDLREGSLAFARGERHDPVLGIFDATGVPLPGAADDDGGPGFLPNRGITVPPGGGGRWTVAVSGYGDTAFDGTHEEEPFDYLLALARDRACPNVAALISNLTASTANPYAIAALEGGDHYYTDRNEAQKHVLVDVPDPLECAEWIKTANDDKSVTTDPHLTFTVSEPATVYIGYDTRVTAEPAWLTANFTPLSLVIDIADPDATQEFDVLRRDFPAGTVELGGNSQPSNRSNYVVIAKPIDTEEAGRTFALPTKIGTGGVTVTVSGVAIQVPTQAGQTPASVAQALADAVNADSALQAARVFAIAVGSVLVVTGSIDGSSLDFTFPVPGLAPWMAALLVALLGAAHVAIRRAR